MLKSLWIVAASASICVSGCTVKGGGLISEQDAIAAALAEVDVEVLGIRFDQPDVQWDVFVRSGDEAYEVEVNAETGEIFAIEEESLEEIQAELSGNTLM